MKIDNSLYKGTSEVPDIPVIFTRFEKGQALTHAEMDTNLTSLIHTCSLEPAKTVKDAEYVTLQYASQSTTDGREPSFCRPGIRFQTMPSNVDVLNRLANETVPGNLTIKNDLWVSGTLHVNEVIYEKTFVPGTQSDSRLKEGIVPVSQSLEKVLSITPATFNWKPEAEKKGHDIGFIAQEVQKVCPEVVVEDKKGYLTVDYAKLVTVLFGAVQELHSRVSKLEENGS